MKRQKKQIKVKGADMLQVQTKPGTRFKVSTRSVTPSGKIVIREVKPVSNMQLARMIQKPGLSKKTIKRLRL